MDLAQLQELYRPFDVGDGALTKLQMELRVLTRGDPLPLDPRLHPPDLPDLLLGHRPAQVGVHNRHEPGADAWVAGHRARPQQGLALPGLAPPVVVRLVPGEAANEVTLPAFGAEADIEVVDGGVGGRPVHEAEEFGGGSLRGREVLRRLAV